MKIEILYFSGCPNWQKAVDRTRRALAELGRADAVIDAQEVHAVPFCPRSWAGSPTILVDGRDLFPAERDPGVGLDTCRIYQSADGLEGAPGLDQLRNALRIALESRKKGRSDDR